MLEFSLLVSKFVLNVSLLVFHLKLLVFCHLELGSNRPQLILLDIQCISELFVLLFGSSFGVFQLLF